MFNHKFDSSFEYDEQKISINAITNVLSVFLLYAFHIISIITTCRDKVNILFILCTLAWVYIVYTLHYVMYAVYRIPTQYRNLYETRNYGLYLYLYIYMNDVTSTLIPA